jgi:UTP--glucose-1-phosphate uridylyltransferase
MSSLKVDAKTLEALRPYSFDHDGLVRFAARLGRSGQNQVTGDLKPPAPGDVMGLPALGTPRRAQLRARGLELLRAKKVAVVILAGGMATRFGGVVKAVVPVLGERTFIDLKIGDVTELARRIETPIPIWVMSSFSTHQKTVQYLDERWPQQHVEVFSQDVSLRLTPEGELFLDDHGVPSPYATGHGDTTFALRRKGLLRSFLAQGGEYVFVSNVDNLGATLDPALIALHVENGAEASVEVVRKAPGDKGGAPARLNGTAQIIEGFRFPPGFDQDSIPVFNTNTLIFSARAIDRDFDLPYYQVDKSVAGRPAVQFERLIGEVTAFLSTRFIEVEREGPEGRFLPAKDVAELQRRLPDIATVAASKRAFEG